MQSEPAGSEKTKMANEKEINKTNEVVQMAQHEEQRKNKPTKGTVRTEVGFNHYEVGWAEDLNNLSRFQVSRITIIEAFRKRGRILMDTQAVNEIQKEIANWKRRYPSTEIIHFFQLRKGTTRTESLLNAVQHAQAGADARCFYEKSRTQSEDALKTQLKIFKKAYPRGKQYVVLEVEGTNINAKVITALNLGFKDFILIGGEYHNPTLWQGLTATIRQAGGKSIGLPYERMNTHSKESRIKFMVQFGVDYVIHGSLGFGKPPQILFLDEQDGIYKPIEQITDTGVLQAVSNTSNRMLYSLSRVLAIDDGNTFAITHPQPIIEE